MTRSTVARCIFAALALACVTATLAPAPALGQAQESVIHVDQNDPRAAATNPGTSERPFDTIRKAIQRANELNRQGTAVRILIAPGIYRESLSLFGDGGTSAAMTLEKAGEGKVVVAGSDVWDGWQQEGDGIFSHEWTFDWGLSPIPAAWEEGYGSDELEAFPLIRRREMVFADGQRLRQVASLDALSTATRSFFVDEGSNRIHIRLPEDKNPATSTIEVAVRPQILSVGSKTNLTINGLTFRHAASGVQTSAATIANSSHVKVANSRFVLNNWNGLSIYRSENVTIENTSLNRNGVAGVTANFLSGSLFLNVDSSYNNWRGAIGHESMPTRAAIDMNFIDYATGHKFFHTRDTTFRNYRSVENLTGGLWFDYDNSGVVLDRVSLRRNLTHGLMVEASQGPFRVSESLICGNETGVLVNNSRGVTLDNSVLVGNDLAQIFVAGSNGPRPVTDYETGASLQLNAGDWSLFDNALGATGQEKAFRTYLSSESWQQFATSLSSDGNNFTNPDQSDVFQVANGELLNLTGWRDETGEDRDSSFGQRRTRCNRYSIPAEVKGTYIVRTFGQDTLDGIEAFLEGLVGSLAALAAGLLP
jgi:hypothetical protein